MRILDFGNRSGRSFNVFGSNSGHLQKFETQPQPTAGWVPPTGSTPGHIAFSARDGICWTNTITAEERGLKVSQRYTRPRGQVPIAKAIEDERKGQARNEHTVSCFLNTIGLERVAKELGLTPRKPVRASTAHTSQQRHKITERPPEPRWPPHASPRTPKGGTVKGRGGGKANRKGAETARFGTTTGMPRASLEQWRSGFEEHALCSEWDARKKEIYTHRLLTRPGGSPQDTVRPHTTRHMSRVSSDRTGL